ncbi:MAG: hypothetical protein U5L45_12070 [Saprospiraceae bacterium]|nr:hypothetical protein [Saprospiraceae bacterium]
MFKTVFSVLVFFCFSSLNAQNLPDSLAQIYSNYLQMNGQRVDSLHLRLNALQTQYTNFGDILKSNNESLKRITNAQLFTFDRSISQQRIKIVNTIDFIRASNASLNALQAVNSISTYLDEIGQLNNPTNTELGFSVTDDIITQLEARVLNKKGIGNKVKFVDIVKNVINAPITTSFVKSFPIVSNIKGVVDLVVSLAVTDKSKIELEDVVGFKKDVQKYVEHYQGLEQANQSFTANLNTINIRVDALKLILKNYTTERLHQIDPSVKLDTFRNLTLLVNRCANKEAVQKHVERILEECKVNGVMNYQKALSDRRLYYPEYALNQAQVINDELVNLSKSFLSNLSTYQRQIETVLTNSKSNKLGEVGKIDKKISELQRLLNNVSEATSNNINLEDLQDKLQKINAF